MLRRAVAIAIVVAALALAFATQALAFASQPPGRSPHDDITREAAEAAGVPTDAVPSLQRAVRSADSDEMEWDPDLGEPKRIDANEEFRPEHHCDRVPPASSGDSFNATVAYVRQQAADAGNASALGDAATALRLLGLALHAAQDCASHSNVVDLGDDAMAAFPLAVLGQAPMPAGLLLTGFEPGADDPEHPRGDPYPHGDHAKDSPGKNADSEERLPDNRTKYEAARGLAVETSRLLLAGWLSERSPEEIGRLERAEVEGGGLPQVGVPLPVWVPVTGVVVAIAAARIRRR